MPDPTVIYRECNKIADLELVDDQVKLAIAEAKPLAVNGQPWSADRQSRLAVALTRLVKALENPRCVPGVECPWAGDVEVSYSGPPGNVKEMWTCPLCGYEHEEVD